MGCCSIFIYIDHDILQHVDEFSKYDVQHEQAILIKLQGTECYRVTLHGMNIYPVEIFMRTS